MSRSPSLIDVAIIGAGPNGLGLASHLRKRGIAHRIFGSPMLTWRNMPENMNLKSLGFATSIPTPHKGWSFPEYCRANGLEDYEPIEFATFAKYGMAFQRDLVPYVEDTKVVDLKSMDDHFVLVLATGERVSAKRVVVAVGLTYFPRIPQILAALPADRLTHTWGPKDFASFADKDVVVVGGGSSAIETATLLHENGARVRILARSAVYWGLRGKREWERPIIDRVRVPISTIGHGRENWVIEHLPWLLHYLPSEKRIAFTRKHLGPITAWWLRDRAQDKFPIHAHTSVLQASVQDDGKIRLLVKEQAVGEHHILADHVIAGTGYEVDLERMSFINAELAQQIRRWERAPRLSRHFESSVSGLYFLGPVAANSFGPLVRFVAGAYYAVPTVAGHLAGQASAVGSLWRRLVGAVPVSPRGRRVQPQAEA